MEGRRGRLSGLPLDDWREEALGNARVATAVLLVVGVTVGREVVLALVALGCGAALVTAGVGVVRRWPWRVLLWRAAYASVLMYDPVDLALHATRRLDGWLASGNDDPSSPTGPRR